MSKKATTTAPKNTPAAKQDATGQNQEQAQEQQAQQQGAGAPTPDQGSNSALPPLESTQEPEKKSTAAKGTKYPTAVVLRAPHGFIDENNRHRYWNADDVVTDPDEITLLHERRAPLVDVTYED